MKKLAYSFGLALLLLACHSDIFPNDLLYQRWQLVQTRQGNGDWVQNKSTAVYDTEYRADGTLVYRLDGKVTGSCCQPILFNRQKNNLVFGDITICGLSLCASPPNTATITQLTNDLLELTRGETISQYKSVK